ncbi:galactosyl transferase [Nitzschia inconspicua]|uniref:Galactosyl transferase n=1 Tax=Nitzschia inconspicua TaxID=303405 RepID=A0A9K3M119_9STRA|nr:galactosyl transferase [Nitzschia inconspicua]
MLKWRFLHHNGGIRQGGITPSAPRSIHNNLTKSRSSTTTTKCSLSTLIRGMYWIVFILLFLMTFLRTHVTLNGHQNRDSQLSSVMESPREAWHIHQESLQRRRIRGDKSDPMKRNNNKSIPQKGSSFSSGNIPPNDQSALLPGLHNPRPDKFNQDAGISIEAEFFANLTFPKQPKQRQQHSIAVDKNTNHHGEVNKVDWWSLLQRFEKSKTAKRIDRRDTGPRSSFVKRLYDLKDELMSVANGTDTSLQVPPAPLPSKDWRMHLAKTPENQPIDFLNPILPPPSRILQKNTTDGVVVLVLSHQGSFIKRQAIRETWARNHSTQVLFVVGQSDCAEFELDLERDVPDIDENGVEVQDQKIDTALIQQQQQQQQKNRDNSTSNACIDIDHNFLRLEQERWQDLLEIPIMESYDRLPEKVLQAYHWVLHNVPQVEWIVKSDDDMFVRIGNLQRYLRKYNPNVPMVIGEIIYHSAVRREGKWAEMEYPNDYYPYWPKGSAGHVISRATATFISDMSHTLHRYQGEDTSIGIWLDEAKEAGLLDDVTYIHAKNMFESHGKDACARPKYMIVGHDLHPDELLECQENYDGRLRENTWLDDPSEFAKMIREEMGLSEWQPPIGYNRPPSTRSLTSNSFGYKAKLD